MAFLSKASYQYPDLFVHRSLGEAITELTHGAHGDDQGNDYIAEQEELLVYGTLASAGYLVDLFPACEFMFLSKSV